MILSRATVVFAVVWGDAISSSGDSTVEAAPRRRYSSANTLLRNDAHVSVQLRHLVGLWGSENGQ